MMTKLKLGYWLTTATLGSTALLFNVGAASAALMFAPGSEVDLTGNWSVAFYDNALDFYDGSGPAIPDKFTVNHVDNFGITGTFADNISSPFTLQLNDIIVPDFILSSQNVGGEAKTINGVTYDLTSLNGGDGFLLFESFENDGAVGDPDPSFKNGLEFWLTDFTRTEGPQSVIFSYNGFYRAPGYEDAPILTTDIVFANPDDFNLDDLGHVPAAGPIPSGPIPDSEFFGRAVATTTVVAGKVPEPTTVLGLLSTLSIGAFATKKTGRKKA